MEKQRSFSTPGGRKVPEGGYEAFVSFEFVNSSV